ncbi:hypothetical protein A7A76_07265 [Lysobacter enzymogenes]|uniref:CPBP family intramembrane glutamic endopeptidase n=1 Tax=Lysobacter enzymogenes TaxID=69 RepID=UPI0019D1BAA7|nr:type II CAAX endopeptidase family protein [Lysobacter enzymogenes]MBN7138901.1 hypothetical protein [Lysobacter enzymogenes]
MPKRPVWYVWGYLLLISTVAFAGALLAMVVLGRNTDAALAWLVRCSLIMLLVVATTSWFIRRDRLSWVRYGVAANGRAVDSVFVGFLGGGALALLWALIVQVWAPFEWSWNPAFRMRALLMAAAAAMALGVAEEVGYRSYGLERMYEQHGALAAVVVPSAVFVLAHLSGGMPWQAAVLVVGTCSLLYGCLMLVTRSLPLVAAFHVANNLIQDALLRTGEGSLWRPEFQNADAPHDHQMAIWACMGGANVIVAACVWLFRAKFRRDGAVASWPKQ